MNDRIGDGMDELICAEQISKTVNAPGGSLTILQPLSLSIGSGQSIAIVGPSGSGKTTLLGILAGLDKPSTGSLRLAGEDITALDEDARARARRGVVGFVFQSFHLLGGLTALENVLLPLELAGEKDALDRAREILTTVGLSERVDHYPKQLSGGEQQRVAIARAFVSQPSILFADEPTGNLDAGTGQQISDLLFRLNAERGTTLVLVTHDMGLAQRCQRVLQLEGGSLLGEAA